MNIETDFIDYLIDFNYEVIFLDDSTLKDTPIFNKLKMIWEFDSSVKTRNYAINKGDPGNINHFNINNIFLAFHNKWIPSYQEHLTKLFSNFVSELHKIKSSFSKDSFLQLMKDYKTKLEKSKNRLEVKLVCYNPEKDFDNYIKEYSYHKDVKIIYHGRDYNERLKEMGFMNFFIADMVENQIQVIDETLGILNEEINAMIVLEIALSKQTESMKPMENESQNSIIPEEKGFKRIRYLANINVLGTLFYDLKKKKYIDSSNVNIIRFLLESFSDEYGEALSKSTIETILNSSKEEKRAKGDSRIKVPDL